MPVTEIRIEQKIILAVKNAVVDNLRNTDKDNINALAEMIHRDYHNMFPGEIKDWKRSIETYTKQFKNKAVDFDSKPFLVFVILCNYLGIGEKPTTNSVFTLDNIKTIIKELETKGVINEGLCGLQSQYFPESDQEHYTVYLSDGKDNPIIGALKLTFNNNREAHFNFGTSASEIQIGTFSCSGVKMHISLPDSNTFQSSMLLKQLQVGSVRKAHFRGIFCSYQDNGEELPTSREVMVFNNKVVAQKVVPDINLIGFKLYDKLITSNRQQYDASLLEDFCQPYEGYWFRVKSSIKVVRVIFEIYSDGSCILKGTNEILTGRVENIDKTKNILKCTFWGNDKVDSLQMILDIKHDKKDFIDGIYCGQKPPEVDLIAGKIRLYKVKKNDQPRSPDVIDLDELAPKIGKRAEELKRFFIGANENLPSSKFLQPNKSTFRQWFDTGSLSTMPEVKPYNGNYLVWKLDNKKKHINQYEFNVNNGEVTGFLRLPNDRKTYEGTANFLPNCLMFNIYRRNGKKYNAVYIFFVGAGNSGDIRHALGVYATTTTFSYVPICGRVILQRKLDKQPVFPIQVYSEDYIKINNSHDQALTLLTGKDDNMIRVSKELNQVSRLINYGSLFFKFACELSTDDDQKLLFVRQAFENGFNDIDQLKIQLEDSLKTFKESGKIKIEEGDPVNVHILYYDKKETYSFPVLQ